MNTLKKRHHLCCIVVIKYVFTPHDLFTSLSLPFFTLNSQIIISQDGFSELTLSQLPTFNPCFPSHCPRRPSDPISYNNISFVCLCRTNRKVPLTCRQLIQPSSSRMSGEPTFLLRLPFNYITSPPIGPSASQTV